MTGLEDTIWVNVGSAAALVGATVGATLVGSMAIARGLQNLAAADPEALQLLEGSEPKPFVPGDQQPRTRFRAEDVLAAEERQQAQGAGAQPGSSKAGSGAPPTQ